MRLTVDSDDDTNSMLDMLLAKKRASIAKRTGCRRRGPGGMKQMKSNGIGVKLLLAVLLLNTLYAQAAKWSYRDPRCGSERCRKV